MSEEHIVYEGKLPFRAAHFSHSLVWLLLLGWNVGLLVSWLQTFGEHLRITSQRVVLRRGIISQEVEEVEYYRIKDTKFQQEGILQRLLNFGSITIYSDDATAPELTFLIPQPEEYREEIRSLVHEERKRMGTVQFD